MLTLRRISNAISAYISYALSLFGVVRIMHYPTFVSIEPANFCQLRCPECPVGKYHVQDVQSTKDKGQRRKAKCLSLEEYRVILDRVAPYAHTLLLYWQGEPLLNHDLPEMVRLAKQRGLFVMISTNAQLLDEQMAQSLYRAGLDRIVISIDGFTQSSYEQYRVGGSLERALAGLRCRAAKVVELQVLRLRTNESEWPWIRQNYRRLGADILSFKSAQLDNFEQGHPLMPTDARYSRYVQHPDGTYRLRKQGPDHACRRLWMGCVVTVDGEVLPCCYDKAHQYPLGNLLHQSLRDVWLSEGAMAFRKHVLRDMNTIPMCRNCAR